jgi:hypothetical protein
LRRGSRDGFCQIASLVPGFRGWRGCLFGLRPGCLPLGWRLAALGIQWRV